MRKDTIMAGGVEALQSEKNTLQQSFDSTSMLDLMQSISRQKISTQAELDQRNADEQADLSKRRVAPLQQMGSQDVFTEMRALQDRLLLEQRKFSVFGVDEQRHEFISANTTESEISFREKEATYQKTKDSDKEKDAKQRNAGKPIADIPERDLEMTLAEIEKELGNLDGVEIFTRKATEKYLSEFKAAVNDLKKTQNAKGRWFGNYSDHIELAAEKYAFYKTNRARIIGTEKAKLLLGDKSFGAKLEEKKSYLKRAGAIKRCIAGSVDRPEEAKELADYYKLTTELEEAKDLKAGKVAHASGGIDSITALLNRIKSRIVTDSTDKKVTVEQLVEQAEQAPMFDLLSEIGESKALGAKKLENLEAGDKEIVLNAAEEYRECCQKALDLRSHIFAITAANIERTGKAQDGDIEAYISSLKAELDVWEFHANANRLCASVLLGRENVDEGSAEMLAQTGYVKERYNVDLKGRRINATQQLRTDLKNRGIWFIQAFRDSNQEAKAVKSGFNETKGQELSSALSRLQKASATAFDMQGEAELRQFQEAYKIDKILDLSRLSESERERTREEYTSAIILMKPLPRFDKDGKLSVTQTTETAYQLEGPVRLCSSLLRENVEPGSYGYHRDKDRFLETIKLLRQAEADIDDFVHGEGTKELFSEKSMADAFNDIPGMPSFERKVMLMRDLIARMFEDPLHLRIMTSDPDIITELFNGELRSSSEIISNLADFRVKCQTLLEFVQYRRYELMLDYGHTGEEWADTSKKLNVMGTLTPEIQKQGRNTKERELLEQVTAIEQRYQSSWDASLKSMGVDEEESATLSIETLRKMSFQDRNELIRSVVEKKVTDLIQSVLVARDKAKSRDPEKVKAMLKVNMERTAEDEDELDRIPAAIAESKQKSLEYSTFFNDSKKLYVDLVSDVPKKESPEQLALRSANIEEQLKKQKHYQEGMDEEAKKQQKYADRTKELNEEIKLLKERHGELMESLMDRMQEEDALIKTGEDLISITQNMANSAVNYQDSSFDGNQRSVAMMIDRWTKELKGQETA